MIVSDDVDDGAACSAWIRGCTRGPRGSAAYSDFFAVMPPDNAATVAPGRPGTVERDEHYAERSGLQNVQGQTLEYAPGYLRMRACSS